LIDPRLLAPWLCHADARQVFHSISASLIDPRLLALWLCHADARQVFDLPETRPL
jgi:hypothetical protein